MSKILIIAEHANGKLNNATAKCLTAAKKIAGSQIDVLVLGADCATASQQAAALDGVTSVKTMTSANNQHALAAILAPQVVAASAGYTHVFGPSTTFGKDLMPRVAAFLGVSQISDIMSVLDSHTFQRPIYAGNAIATVKAPSGQIIVATIRGASFAATGNGSAIASIEAISASAELPNHTRFVHLEAGGGERPDLQSANIVVSGGRAMGSEANFKIVYDLADKLKAGAGASRAAVDAGYAPNDMQVGQTGKIISPGLYVALGISGAIQHLTGIKDAGTIVAINKDGEAPIFEVADIGLVADLFVAVPELMAALG
jgi:electron transfer flavoprotein alpha subunit